MAATAVATPRIKTSGPAYSGLLNWLTTVDHKKIGIMYLWATFSFFLVGGILALLVRTQLAVPESQFMHDLGVVLGNSQANTQQIYNQVFSMHGTTMIFLFVIPMWSGWGNYIVPLQIADAYCAIANGGTLYQPHVASRIQASDGRIVKTFEPEVMGHLPISQRQATALRNDLTNVPRIGTAASAFLGFPLDRIPVAGKTGTADIIPKQPVSWFAGMAPASDPKYVVVVMVEQGGHGAATAAPIARRIFEGLFGLQSAKLQAGQVAD